MKETDTLPEVREAAYPAGVKVASHRDPPLAMVDTGLASPARHLLIDFVDW